jgi:hypothetical protein
MMRCATWPDRGSAPGIAGKQRLVVAEPHDQELLVEVMSKTLFELTIIAHAHLLPAQILVDLERVPVFQSGRDRDDSGSFRNVSREVDETNRGVAALLAITSARS